MARQRISALQRNANWFVALLLVVALWILFRIFVSPFLVHFGVTPKPAMVGTWEGMANVDPEMNVLKQPELRFRLLINSDGKISGLIGDGEFLNAPLARSSALSFLLGLGRYHSWVTVKSAIVAKDKLGWAGARLSMWHITKEQMYFSFETLDPVKPGKPQLRARKFVLTKIQP